MTEPVELYIVASSADRYAAFHHELASLPHVHVMKDYAEALRESEGFDAFFESLMSAKEWCAMPVDAPLYQTRVIKMPDHQVAQGRPLYGIPGIPVETDDEFTAQELTRLILSESFRAIAAFNAVSAVNLRKIGAVDLSLGLDEIKPEQAFDIFENLFRSNSDSDGSPTRLSAHRGNAYSDLYR